MPPCPARAAASRPRAERSFAERRRSVPTSRSTAKRSRTAASASAGPWSISSARAVRRSARWGSTRRARRPPSCSLRRPNSRSACRSTRTDARRCPRRRAARALLLLLLLLRAAAEAAARATRRVSRIAAAAPRARAFAGAEALGRAEIEGWLTREVARANRASPDQTIAFAICFASSRSLSDSRIITAVSSIARPVTSITGQPGCLPKMLWAYASSAFTWSFRP